VVRLPSSGSSSKLPTLCVPLGTATSLLAPKPTLPTSLWRQHCCAFQHTALTTPTCAYDCESLAVLSYVPEWSPRAVPLPAAGQQSEVPSAVDIRYFTANGASVTRTQHEAAGVESGSHANRALSSDGSQVVWDQALLAAHPTCFVFAPESPQLSVSWDAAAVHVLLLCVQWPLYLCL
jgi:hypothetical protein